MLGLHYIFFRSETQNIRVQPHVAMRKCKLEKKKEWQNETVLKLKSPRSVKCDTKADGIEKT